MTDNGLEKVKTHLVNALNLEPRGSAHDEISKAIDILDQHMRGGGWCFDMSKAPIDTPLRLKTKDGREFIGGRGGCLQIRWYALHPDSDTETEKNDGYVSCGYLRDIDNQTAWQPLPAPPKEGE